MALGCYVVGRYTIVNFPRTVHNHKASLEMLPPIIFISVFLTIPLTFLSLGMSQYSKKGWILLWDAKPIWRGIGIAGIICLFVSTLKNHSIATYFLYYAVRGLDAKPPWLDCGNQSFLENGCFTIEDNRSIHLDCIDIHGEEHCDRIEWKNSAKFFYDNLVKTHVKSTEPFSYNGNLMLYQAIVSLVVYICLRNSTESLALLSPFMLIFPTVLHALLLIRSFLHPGTLRGLKALSEFKFTNILSINFWIDLCSLAIYGTGFAHGGLSNFGTHYPFRHPINIDAVFLNLISVTYSLMYTVFLYNIYGMLSYELNIPLDEIVSFDKEDNFIQCALSFTHMNMTKFWTVAFYFSNFMVVLRNLATQCETFLCTFYDMKPSLKRFTIPCALVFSFSHFLCLSMMNFNVVHYFILDINFMIVFIVAPLLAYFLYTFLSHFYGVMLFVDDMHFMLGFRPSNIWKINWYVGFLVYLSMSFFGMYHFSKKDIHEAFPVAFYCVFVVTAVICLIPVIYFIIFVFIKYQQNVPCLEIFKSSKQWGPREEFLRKSRDMFSAHDMSKEYLYRQQKLRSKFTEPQVPKTTTE